MIWRRRFCCLNSGRAISIALWKEQVGSQSRFRFLLKEKQVREGQFRFGNARCPASDKSVRFRTAMSRGGLKPCAAQHLLKELCIADVSDTIQTAAAAWLLDLRCPLLSAKLRSPPAERRSASSRLFSLDVFRGATIAAMILVNNPGNDFPYAPLEHSKWNGWTPTDLIFPFFLFIVGVSLVLSFRSRMRARRVEADAAASLLCAERDHLSYRFVLEWISAIPSLHLAGGRSPATDRARLSRSAR